MLNITEKNVTSALPVAVMHLKHGGVVQESQHGVTIEYPEPVSVCYQNPMERVLFNDKREPNPFFQFFESLWILAGRDDVAFLTKFNKNMANYSDNKIDYYGAYGMRLRNDDNGDGFDQIQLAIDRLKANQDDRQVVLTIRRARDLWYTGKDTPCNMLVACKIREGRLNIHVMNRSNDLLWGMMGTNIVQFSMLQEYMANKIGCGVGTYHQTTDSMHVYANDLWDIAKEMSIVQYDPYYTCEVEPYPLGADSVQWDKDLDNLFDHFDNAVVVQARTQFFKEVVWPMYNTWEAHKEGKPLSAIEYVNSIGASDWRLACFDWLVKRYAVLDNEHKS